MRYFYLFLTLMMFSNGAIAGNPQVTVETNRGSFVLELYPEKAPKTVANFLEYANSGFYSGTIFHRVINRFMIQGGGFSPAMMEKDTRAPIVNEAGNGLTNEVGTIALLEPWTQEPDYAEFTLNGFTCVIRRPYYEGHLCGYVGLPEGHKFFGKDYDAIEAHVHGGLTYSEFEVQNYIV